jgi:hypothetical protein
MDTPDSAQGEECCFGSAALDKISELATESVTYIEQSTRRSPLKAVSFAVAAGYLLRHLPIFSIIGALLRLALILVRPFALIFASVKLCQYLSGTAPFKRPE